MSSFVNDLIKFDSDEPESKNDDKVKTDYEDDELLVQENTPLRIHQFSSTGQPDEDDTTITAWDKFKLLLWKNWKLQLRHPIQTVLEILAPVAFSILLVIIRSLVDPEIYPEPTYYKAFDPTSIPFPKIDAVLDILKNFSITWSPYSPFLLKIMESIINETGMKSISFNNSQEMWRNLTQLNGMNTTFAGVMFPDTYRTLEDFPQHVNFSLVFPGESRFEGAGNRTELLFSHWRTNLLFPLYQMAGPRTRTANDGGYPPGYNKEGFLILQHLVTSKIIDHIKNQNSSDAEWPNIYLQRYPYPEFIEDPLLPALSGFVSMIFLLSFVYTCINSVKTITTEKEKQLKETMKIMGLPCWLHWTAWFLKIFVYVAIATGICTILVTTKWYPGKKDVAVFTSSSPTIIFFVLLMYMMSTVTFCFMISVFFSSANKASTIAGLVWFLGYTPFLFLQQRYDTLSWSSKMFSSLSHNSAMAYAFNLIIRSEGSGEGMHWSNLFLRVNSGDSLVLAHVIGMFILDTLIYLLVALYVEQIFPGTYGIPQPWNYPFTIKYWCGEKKVNAFEKTFEPPASINPDIYEQEPNGLKAGIQIKNLTKLFGAGTKQKIAVNSLNLNMYEDQITCLLGHNGAGKTTTMSMLTGMIPPTSGTATVNNFDIRTEVDKVRSSLGLCPQHNVLFDELTVSEHLYFYGRLKGVSKTNIEKEISRYVELLQLIPKKNSNSNQLSGGMQRKLSVGIALCGGSKVVIFDEPTSGMDPSARRFLWDLLQKEKKGRTMVLSTHFMDEADLLGDRIAIMANGELQCCGSSFFLKKRYGAGYHLIMEKSPQCKPDEVTDVLREYIPDLDIYTNIGSELTYILAENNISVFEDMLKRLEIDGERLGINNFGISLTTLEEVFMKVGDESNKKEANKEENGNTPNNKRNDVALNLDVESSRITGMKLLMIQFYSMLMKRILVTYRSRMLLITQIIIPTAMLIIAILVIRNYKQEDSLPPLALDIRKYPGSISIINSKGQVDESAVNITTSFKNYFKKIQKPLNQIESGDFEEYILKKTREAMKEVRTKYITAFTILEKGDILCWFNNEAYHSAPIALSLAHNAFLGTIDPKRSITVFNRPLPFTLQTKIEKLAKANNLGFQLAFNLGFSMALVSSFYVLFYIKERVCKSKHIQFVSGVNVITFWISAYICDLFTFLLTIVLVIITFICFQEDGYNTPAELGRVFFIFFLFGISMLPMMYLFSLLFDIPSTGFVRMVLLNILTGVAGFIVIEVLGSPALDLKHIANILEWIFIVIPHYACSSSIRSTYKVYSQSALCKFKCEDSPLPLKDCLEEVCRTIPKCCDLDENYFSWKAPGIGRQIFFFILTCIVLFAILFLIEFEQFKYLSYWLKKKCTKQQIVLSEPDNLDDDVLEEKKRIERASPAEIKNHSLVMRNVTKYYDNFLAVNQLSIGVRKYECFGLLGINGAGKTSTFKMMTGDETITYGDAWVNGINLKSNLKDVHKIIGYCPQFDALIDNMTGRETLRMYCYLRGINKIDTEDLAVTLASELDFLQHIDKEVRAYSGGNKRKLSTAIALVANPAVIYLDEPTTGMDPATKRHLWNVLCNVRDSGRCVVLTSHSMEECEALCTKIAIMVNGQFQCLGSVQHLKNKFSCGYTLTVKVQKSKTKDSAAGTRPTNIDNIIRYIEDTFRETKLREEHNELLTFYIADKSLTWSRMFGIMEEARKQLNFEDYSLGQSTLEQVFLSFTRTQREE